jgi:hypothetical protein
MDVNSESKPTEKLVSNLEDLTKQYRGLLDLVRRERDLLITAQITDLEENNRAKENLLYKIKALDVARERYAKEAAAEVGADVAAPRLLEIARHLIGPDSDRLRTMHSTLEKIMERLAILNKENATYTQSALNLIGGAMGEVKSTLSGKKTYGQKGNVQPGADKAGHLVSKEA